MKEEVKILGMTQFRIAYKTRYVKMAVTIGSVVLTGSIIAIMFMMAFMKSSLDMILLMTNIDALMMLPLAPVIVSFYIAADSFVGEKERRTIEPLLLTPLNDREILLGKYISSLYPAMIIFVASLVAVIASWYITALIFNYPLFAFPDPSILLSIIVSGILISISSVSIMFIISERVKNLFEAYQVGGIVVLFVFVPFIAALQQIQSSSTLISFDIIQMLIILGIDLLIAIVPTIFALDNFNRDRLVSR